MLHNHCCGVEFIVPIFSFLRLCYVSWNLKNHSSMNWSARPKAWSRTLISYNYRTRVSFTFLNIFWSFLKELLGVWLLGFISVLGVMEHTFIVRKRKHFRLHFEKSAFPFPIKCYCFGLRTKFYELFFDFSLWGGKMFLSALTFALSRLLLLSFQEKLNLFAARLDELIKFISENFPLCATFVWLSELDFSRRLSTLCSKQWLPCYIARIM